MELDRTELNDLYNRNPSKARELEDMYARWAERCGVLPWNVIHPNWNPAMLSGGAHKSG